MIAVPRLLAAGLAVLGTVAIAVSTAHAQNAQAEALFNEAERLEAAGKLGDACDAFEGSNRLEPRAGTLIRLGQCREAEGKLASAWVAFKDALTRVKDPKKREIAEAAATRLEPKLSYLTVSVPDASRVDGLVITRNGEVIDPVLWNRAAPVDGGSHVIAGRAPGHEEWRTTVEVADERDKETVDVPVFKQLRDLVKPPPVGGDDGAEPREAPGTFTGRRKLALGVGVLGVIAIGGGAAMGATVAGLENEAFQLCPEPETACDQFEAAQDKIDRANRNALLANVGFGVGAAAIVGATVLWLTGGPEQPAEENEALSITPRVGPDRAGIDVMVRF